MKHFESSPDLIGLTSIIRVTPETETLGDKVVYAFFNFVRLFKNNVSHVGEASGEFQMVRAPAFKRINGYREDLVTREDADLFWRLSRIGTTYCDKSLIVYQTGRRGHAIGWVKLVSIWVLDSFWVMFFNKSLSKDWKAIRLIIIRISMKISVVIPAYNEEASLPATIKALLAQTYSDFEIIVVNNASTDRTAEVAQSFGGKVKLVNESRKGLLWAREAGRTAASGEIIANIDADCLPKPDWLSKGSKYFSDQKVSAVSGPYDYYDAGFFFRYISLFTEQTLYWLMSRIIQLPFIKTGALLIGGNNFIRASALEKAGGYNTAITFYGEDTDTAKRVATQGRVVFTNRLVMKTSARRFKAEGIINLELKYLKYFFKTIFTEARPM